MTNRTARLLLAACALILFTGPAQAQEKRARAAAGESSANNPVRLALLIGINEYEDPGIRDLRASINDVESTRQLLQDYYAFEPRNILLLTDRAATRRAILDGFREHLIENARRSPNAVVYIHFSGVGTKVVDTNGDEADGFDEALVPSDARMNGLNCIKDDELEEMLAALSEHAQNVTFVYDTDYGFEKAGEGERRTRIAARALERPPAATSRDLPVISSSPPRPGKSGIVVITASLPDQVAYELSPDKTGEGKHHSALTLHLLRALRKTPVTTYRDLMQRVTVGMAADAPNQIPQADGDLDRLFLGGAARAFEVEASAAGDTHVRLRGGRRQGLREGVRVTVYKPQAKSLTDYRDILAEAVVVRADDDSTVAKLSRKVAIPADATAVLSAPDSAERLRVAFDLASLSGLANGESIINSLSERFDSSASAVVAGETQSVVKPTADETWDVAVAAGKFGRVFGAIRPQLEAMSGGGRTRLPTDDEDVLYLSRIGGQPLFGFFVEATSAEAAKMVIEAVHQAAAQRRVQRLYHENSPLNKALEVSVVRVDGELTVAGMLRITSERPVVAEEGTGTTFSLKYGELFLLKVRNKNPEAVYLAGLNLRADAKVEVFKQGDEDDKLRSGTTYISPVFRATGLAGEDVFKFIASDSPFPILSATRGADLISIPKWGTTQVSLLVAAPAVAESYPRGRVVEQIGKSLHVLAIGINKYQDPSRRLRFSVQDASAMSAALTERGGEMYNVRAHLLLDEQATRAGIEAAFNTIIREAQPEDAFVFYTAASDSIRASPDDTKDAFIVPQDVSQTDGSSDWQKNAVTGELLRNWVSGVKAQNQLLIFDSSTAAAERFVLRLTEDRKLAAATLKKNIVIFAGNGVELEEVGHGESTHHLLRGLGGGAYFGLARNQITVRDLQHFLRGAKSRQRGSRLFQSFSIGDDFALGGVPKELAEKTRDVHPDTDSPDGELGRVVRTGKDYALLIATGDYGESSSFEDLPNPVRDAEAVGRVLEERYGFEVEVVRNKTKSEIEQLIESKYLELGAEDDQLFIFFAGHGKYDKRLRDGGIAVKDSVAKDINTYLRFEWVKSRLEGFSARHVLVVVDVCYSGTFFKSVLMRDRDPRNRAKMSDADYYKDRIKIPTRKALASSADKPVFDGIPGTHSPFVTELLSVLNKTDDKELVTYDDLKRAVERVKPGPVGGDFGGEAGSDFFFVPKRKTVTAGRER